MAHQPANSFSISSQHPFNRAGGRTSNVGREKKAKKIPCKPHGIAHGPCMKTITATSARSDLYRVIDSAVSDHEPVHITGKRGNAVLVGEADWRAIQETLYLVSIPGMRDSIRHGMEEPIANCSREIDL
jgi:antitoxin YefM